MVRGGRGGSQESYDKGKAKEQAAAADKRYNDKVAKNPIKVVSKRTDRD